MAAPGEALVAVLEASTSAAALEDALRDVRALLEPLLALGGTAGSASRCGLPSADALRNHGRTLGPLVTRLIKALGARLGGDELRGRPEQLRVLADAAVLALTALDCLRPVLKAAPHDLDAQRYGFIRKLTSLGQHEHALAQGQVLHAAVACSASSAAGPEDLQVAAVANLLVCYSEMAHANPARAGAIWADVSGPAELALQAASNALEASAMPKRMEPVLKCLCKAVEKVQHVGVASSLGPAGVAQQLAAMVAAGACCRQEEAVQQALVCWADAGGEAVQALFVEALLSQLQQQGSLHEALLQLLHHSALALLEKRSGTVMPSNESAVAHAAAATVRAALQLPHCLQPANADAALPHVSAELERVAAALANDRSCGPAQRWERWSCLDVLRTASASVLAQLVSMPQSTGGMLPAIVQCMELLARDSASLLDAHRTSHASEVLSSGCSAAVMAVRLLVVHRIYTGQLADLHEDVLRTTNLVRRLLAHQGASMGRAQSVEPLRPSTLQSLSASLGNAGLDLLQVQLATPAAEALQLAAELALARARQVRAGTAALGGADAPQLVKKCKAHVTALEQLGEHKATMAAAAEYVWQLHALVHGNTGSLASLIKLHSRATVACFRVEAAERSAAAAARPAPAAAPSSPAACVTAAPAAPAKAGRRGRRVQRAALEEQEEQAHAACAPAHGRRLDDAVSQGGTQPHAPASSLVQDLTAKAQAGLSGHAADLLGALDMYAVHELEAVAEECKRAEEGGFRLEHTRCVLGVLKGCITGSDVCAHARVMLLEALVGGADLEAQVAALDAARRLLEPALQAGAPHPAAGVLDTAALVYVQLGLCVARCRLAQPSGTAHRGLDPLELIARGIGLWQQLVAMHAGGGEEEPTLRMPQAVLQAAVEALHYVHLNSCAAPQLAADTGSLLCQLIRTLSAQVKLRDQQVHLLAATMPAATCVAWALAAQPLPCLADAAGSQAHGKLELALDALKPMRAVLNAGLLDHASLATAAAACASELEHGGFLRHGPAPLLLRSQCHHVAAAARMRAGDVAQAHMHAQEALRITCGLYSMLECPPQRVQPSAAEHDADGQTPAGAAAAAVQSGAVASAQDYALGDDDDEDTEGASGSVTRAKPGAGQPLQLDAAAAAPSTAAAGRGVAPALGWAIATAHLASLHQAAQAFEAAGCVEDAVCLWKECGRTAGAFGVTGMAALSACHLTSVSCRRHDAAAAAAHLEAANAAMEQLHDGGCSAGRGVEGELLAALASAARARCELQDAQTSGEGAAYEWGLAACDGVWARGSGCDVAALTSCSHAGHGLRWMAACTRSQLVRLNAEGLLRAGKPAEAARELRAAYAWLQRAAADMQPGASAPTAWPVDCGLLVAHEAAAALGAAAPRHASGGCAGRACTSHTRIVGLGKSLEDSGAAPPVVQCDALMEDADGQSHTDQTSKKGGRQGRSTAARGKATVKQATAAPAPASAAAAVPATSLGPLLLAMRLCWQVPLAAAHACRHLLSACMALGLPHAAAMFLHLSQGPSYAQQQALHRQQLRRQRLSAADAAPAEPLLGAPDVRAQALAAIDSLGAEPQPAEVESAAEAWLRGGLQLLSADALLVSITHDPDGGGLLLGRVHLGCPPLLVSLPCSSGASDQAGPVAELARCSTALQELLEQSGDSMRTDQDVASSQSRKAQWWKARTALDERVQALLQTLDESVVGAWRCLLLPVSDSQRAALGDAALAFAIEHFPALAGEGAGTSLQVAGELVLLLLAHRASLQSSETRNVLGVLSRLAGVPVDAAGLSALEASLEATETAARMRQLSLPRAQHEPEGPCGASASAPTATTSSKADAPQEAPGARGRRAPRLACMQADVASQAPAPRASSRTTAARPPTRTRAAAAPAAASSRSVPRAPSVAASDASGASSTADSTSASGEGPVLLTLGPALHGLPWESMPCLRSRAVCRVLSLPIACTAAAAAPNAARTPGAAAASVSGCQAARSSTSAGSLSSVFYLLNPSGDLTDTQSFFQPLLEAQPNWQGFVGTRPGPRELLAALQAHELYMYFGHGSGEQLLPLPALRRLPRCASCLIMGCSSGRLRTHGEYDPAGAAVSYILAGAHALVANLWDVTDRDIDRYAQALMAEWLGCGDGTAGALSASSAASSASSSSSSKGGGGVAGGRGAAGRQPKSVQEPPPSSDVGVGGAGLALAVARSRGACKLQHLIGAAPVCYGLPQGEQAGHA